MRPRDAVIICGTPRSGSTLLCGALRATNLCGRADEYFESQTLGEHMAAWGLHSRDQYVRHILDSETSPNGVFSVKVHWHHMSNLRALLQPPNRPWRRRKQNPFVYLAPRQHFVFLRRRDKVRQAVSQHRATLTNTWHKESGDPERVEEVLPQEIDIPVLRWLIECLDEWEQGWHDFFARVGVTSLELWYEDDLEASCEAAVLRVLDAAGIDRPGDLRVHTDLQPTRDAWTEAVVQIYRDLESR